MSSLVDLNGNSLMHQYMNELYYYSIKEEKDFSGPYFDPEKSLMACWNKRISIPSKQNFIKLYE